MAKENENQTLREYGNRKKRYKRRRNFFISVLILALAVAGVAYVVKLYNKSYTNFKVVKAVNIAGESTVGYLNYGSSVIKYGKNGVEAYNKDGTKLWNGSYEMSDPIADTCGKYVVIADRGGKSVYIFNEKGPAADYKADYNIVKVEIASQGVVAALMEDGNNNYIYLYYPDGTNLIEEKNTVNNEGFPMDIALSNDGKKLASVYMTIMEGKVTFKVAFYNYGEVGQNITDGFVGGWNIPNSIVPRVTFLNNDTACLYKDDGFDLYSVAELAKITHKEKLKGKILSVLHNKSYTGVVLEAEDGSSPRLMIYNLNGKRVLDKRLDFKYKKIFLTDKELIMYDTKSCIVMKLNGKVKFKYTFDGNIGGFYPINNLDQYFLVNESKLSDIQLLD